MDIYFKKEYGKICEIIEDGICDTFEYSSDNGTVHNMFIKRAIPIKVNGKQFYDITTPYGYGGPIIINKIGDKDELINEYSEAFKTYCEKENIICEFVRFHPLYNNALDFRSVYEVEAIRKTVGTDLNVEDPVAHEFSKRCRKDIRHALNNGVSYRITECPENIDEFINIYYSTMDRDKAADFYYFSKTYFDMLIELLKNELVLVEAIYQNRVIAANICFVTDGNIHIHLSGTLTEYLKLSPAYVLKYAITMWGKEKGLNVIHHGGGISNSDEDSLYRFKKKFGKNKEFIFHIGKIIRNKAIYEEITKLAGNKDTGFFPAYRKKR